MKNSEKQMDVQKIFPLVITILMCLAVHGYRFSNNIFSHDALLDVVQNDAAWEVALGRFFQPVLVFFRGTLCSPWLLCLLQSVWLALAVHLLVDVLQIRKRSTIAAVAGVVVSSETFIVLNASFLTWSDIYAFALFAAVLGVCCIEKKKILYTLLGICFLVISLATYQAYICVAITLMLMLAVLSLCRFETDWKDIIKRVLYYVVILIFAVVIYYVLWQFVRGVLGIWAAEGYNGMASVGQYGQGEIFASVLRAYENVFTYFAEPTVMTNIVFRGMKLSDIWKYALVIINAVMVGVILYGVILVCHRQRVRQKPKAANLAFRYICLALALLLFPMACNFVCIMSKGMEHVLMMFGTVMLYVFAAIVAEKAECRTNTDITDAEPVPAGRFCFLRRITVSRLVFFLLCVVVWVHFVYANQIYLKKAQQEKAAYSMLTRIVADVEDMPGYMPGITQVAISGHFEDTPCLTELSGFEDLKPYSMGKTSLTYQGTDYAMITYYLGVNMNLTRVDASDEAIKQMPLYPAEGSITEINGIIVVKISSE